MGNFYPNDQCIFDRCSGDRTAALCLSGEEMTEAHGESLVCYRLLCCQRNGGGVIAPEGPRSDTQVLSGPPTTHQPSSLLMVIFFKHFLNFSITTDRQYYMHFRCTTLQSDIYINLQSDRPSMSSAHLIPYIATTILLTVFPVLHFIPP